VGRKGTCQVNLPSGRRSSNTPHQGGLSDRKFGGYDPDGGNFHKRSKERTSNKRVHVEQGKGASTFLLDRNGSDQKKRRTKGRVKKNRKTQGR